MRAYATTSSAVGDGSNATSSTSLRRTVKRCKSTVRGAGYRIEG